MKSFKHEFVQLFSTDLKNYNACSATNEIENPFGFYNEYLREKGHLDSLSGLNKTHTQAHTELLDYTTIIEACSA